MGSGSENAVERRRVGGEPDQVNAAVNHSQDVQLGQRVVNKIDLNIFCAQDGQESNGNDGNIHVSLPARPSSCFRWSPWKRRLRDQRFLLKTSLVLSGVCLLVSLYFLVTCETRCKSAQSKEVISGDPCAGVCDSQSFCEVRGQVPFCMLPGSVLTLTTNPEAQPSNNYTWYPAPRDSVVRFKVKADHDANIFISQAANPTNFPYYWVIIGGGSNKWSAISMNRFLEAYYQAHVDSPEVLSAQECRGFWLSFVNATVAVGKEGEIIPFMSFTDKKPLTFKFFGLSSYSEASWIIYGAGCGNNEQCGEGRACVSGVGACGDPCQTACDPDSFCETPDHDPVCFNLANTTKLVTNVYSIVYFDYTFYPMPASSIVRFRVRASNDANVLLSDNADSKALPYYEIIIGGTSNTRSGIRINRQYLSVHKVLVETDDFLSQSLFRGFWVRFRAGEVAVGKENETTPFMSWVDPQPFSVKFYGLSTFGAEGEWIIFND